MSALPNVLAGAAAGLVATAPMSAVMKVLHTQLPAEEQYPLPPRQITVNAADAVGAAPKDEETQHELTLAAHFAYGATCGAIYSTLEDRVGGPAAVKGIGFGLAVWASSYLGWLPAAGLLAPATKQPARRTALMIAAHVVWGAALGLLADRLADD